MRRWIAAAAALALLAGCGNNPGTIDDVKLIRETLAKRARGGPPAAPPVIPRAALDLIGKPLLYGEIAERRLYSVFALLQTRGPLVTWGSSDGATLTLRDGILVASRGLGADLTSAAVPTLAQISRGAGPVARVHYGYRGGDREVPSRFDCTLSFLGTTALEVSELVYNVRHVVEACTGADGTFRNEYWIESGGKLRQSRQWVGESVGYLELRLLSR